MSTIFFLIHCVFTVVPKFLRTLEHFICAFLGTRGEHFFEFVHPIYPGSPDGHLERNQLALLMVILILKTLRASRTIK